ncbi:DUF4262 domain-containing protein [Deinococcus psychrotolerans]|uniref:DUF4262 domain-containing protein n=1 Tax=Deinococcus psychrotolerans TaxID=2489213 RepID=A0A3G8YRJ5_9DEIO|nr:DUF4262 domain-containing protein [Deinococcus psychrotolerans]AZI44381.1 DUF4262 domain-containing protein [Deinococcus psychrotolerans]
MNPQFPEPENDFDVDVLRGIQEYGWFVLKVPEDAEDPGFAFTVGLWANYLHPELIMFGLSLKVMHEILNLAGNEVSRKMRRFESGQQAEGLIEDHSCTFMDVGSEAYDEYLGYAQWLYRKQMFPVLQCVWPDRQGFFPWHAGFLEELRSHQPILGRN